MYTTFLGRRESQKQQLGWNRMEQRGRRTARSHEKTMSDPPRYRTIFGETCCLIFWGPGVPLFLESLFPLYRTSPSGYSLWVFSSCHNYNPKENRNPVLLFKAKAEKSQLITGFLFQKDVCTLADALKITQKSHRRNINNQLVLVVWKLPLNPASLAKTSRFSPARYLCSRGPMTQRK